MPFINNHANNILNVSFGKTASMGGKSAVYFLLGNLPVDEEGNVVYDLAAPALGFVELSPTTGDAANGYARKLVARMLSSTSGNVTTLIPDTSHPYLGSAEDRGIQNVEQINWTKAVVDWERVNAFAVATSPTVGETDSIYFAGGLTLTEADKAAGGLLTEAGEVALFDPETFRIEFPAEDVAIA